MARDTLITAPGKGCPVNTGCANYTLGIPAANPSVGTFNPTGAQQPAPPSGGAVNYTLDAQAFVPGGGGQADCTPSDLQTNMTNTHTPLTVTVGGSSTAATLAFTSCE